jgi:hypothetical protein
MCPRQVLLCVTQPEAAGGASGRPTPRQPPKGGSYSTLGQSFGVQRLPGGGGYVRVVAQQRVSVQVRRGIRRRAHHRIDSPARTVHFIWALSCERARLRLLT